MLQRLLRKPDILKPIIDPQTSNPKPIHRRGPTRAWQPSWGLRDLRGSLAVVDVLYRMHDTWSCCCDTLNPRLLCGALPAWCECESRNPRLSTPKTREYASVRVENTKFSNRRDCPTLNLAMNRGVPLSRLGLGCRLDCPCVCQLRPQCHWAQVKRLREEYASTVACLRQRT